MTRKEIGAPNKSKQDRKEKRRNVRKGKTHHSRGLEEGVLYTLRGKVKGWFRVLKKLTFITVKVLFFVSIVGGAIAVGKLVERHVRTSESFSTKEIRIKGIQKLERVDILNKAGISIGQNIFKVSEEIAKKRLLEHPWISEADVTRRLPDSYSIKISERRAVAIILIKELYLIDSNGIVFKQVDDRDPFNLPVITGVNPEEFTSNRGFRSFVLTSVITLLDDYARVGLKRREPIGEIHLERDRGLSLYIGKDSTYVRLGTTPFRIKLRRLRKVLDRLEKNKTQAAYVFLNNIRRPDRVTVRLR